MRQGRWLYVLLAVGVLVWWWAPFSKNDDARIRSQLDRLEKLVEKSPGESALESADRARKVTGLLVEDFVVNLGPVGQTVTDAAALARPFVGLRRGIDRLAVGFSDVEIEIEVPGRQALSLQVATVTAVGGQWSRRSFETSIVWRVESGEWRIALLEVGSEI